MLFNIAFFLIVAAVVIAVVMPKSKTDVWLYSVLIPIFLVFWVALFNSFFDDTFTDTSYKIASALGESLVSIIISFITMFVYLKKKLATNGQFKYPKSLIAAIIVFVALGLFAEWGKYRRNKVIEDNEKMELNSKIENKNSLSQSDTNPKNSQSQSDAYSKNSQSEKGQEDIQIIDDKTKEARIVLPELIKLINDGLPITREGMTMKSLKIKNDVIVLSLIIDEKTLNYDVITNDILSDKLGFFKAINANNKQIINKIIEAEYDYTVEIKASNSGKTKGFKLSAKELKNALK